MRITPSASSMQTLKAQQAWEARRSSRVSAPETPQVAPQETPSDSAMARAPRTERVSAPAAPETTQPAPMPQWERRVREIQQIAEKAGYIGVSEQDIRQAYTRGESLLADYRV